MGISEVAGTGTATIELGGVEYTLSVLTLDEYAAIENDIKEDMRKELVKDTADVDMPPLDRVEYIRSKLAEVDIVTALKSQSKISIISMAYHSIKRKHPDVKRRDVAGHMTIDKLTEVAGNISIIMGTGSKKAKGRTKAAKK